MPRFRRRGSPPRPAGSPGAGGRDPRDVAVPAAARSAVFHFGGKTAKGLPNFRPTCPSSGKTSRRLAHRGWGSKYRRQLRDALLALRSAGHRHPPGPPQACRARSGLGLTRRAETEILRIRESTGTSREKPSALQPEPGTRSPDPSIPGRVGNFWKRPALLPAAILARPGRVPRPATYPGTHSCSPGRERWQQLPGEHPGMPGEAASPCLGHLLVSSPEIPTAMPVTPSTQTLRRLPGLGAQPRAPAKEVAAEGTASSLPMSRRGRAGTYCPLPCKHGPIHIFARKQSGLIVLLAIP
ncbi:uncharacterized protein LOC136016285 [Lathamus discolor]|uniref:uncharacterized protein LOC136016285 n=1 Tax=Lathamus discolor TaxID=678569 RepID=UPI0032B865C8